MASSTTPLIFEVLHQRASGAFRAECLNAVIETSGSDLEELHNNLMAAATRHYGHDVEFSPSDIHLLMYEE